MLNVVDNQWKDHLLSMDHLKEGIGLRGYGQKDPLIEYKKESFTMFQDMMDRIEDETIKYLYFMRIEAGCQRAAAVSGNRRAGRGGPKAPEPRLSERPRQRNRSAAKKSASIRTSPATYSAEKIRRWPRCSFERQRLTGIPKQSASRDQKLAATNCVLAAAGRNTRNVTVRRHSIRLSLICLVTPCGRSILMERIRLVHSNAARKGSRSSQPMR